MNFTKKLFQNKSFFKRTLFIFLSILISAVLATSLIIFFSVHAPFEKSLTESQHYVVNHIGKTTDTYILGQLDLIYKQHFLPARRNNDINRLLAQTSETSSFSLTDKYRIYTYLYYIGLNYPFIDSIDIYAPDLKTVVSSKRGLAILSSITQSKMAHFNTKKADEFMASDLPNLWVSERGNREFPKNSDYLNTISLYYPLTGLDGMTRRGLVCFNIQSSVLIDYMSGFLHSGKATFLVFNRENILLSSDSDTDYSDIFTHIKNSPDGLMTLDDRSVMWTSSKMDSLKYVVLTDSAQIYRELIRATQLSIFITITIILIAAMLIYYCSMRLYHPIRRMIEKISHDIPKEIDDELSYIDNVIENLSYKVQDLESTIDDHKDAITNQVVYDIINSNITGVEEVRSRLELSGIDFHYSFYTLIFTEIDNVALNNMDYEQKEYLFYTTLEKLNSMMDKIGLCLSIRHKNFIISILALDDIEALGKITPQRLNLASCINIGICPPKSDITLLGQDFLMLNTYMQYSYIYGYGYIFNSDTIEKYETNSSVLPDNMLDEIKNLLSANKIDGVKETFLNILHLIRTNGFSYSYTHHILLQIINHIAKSYKSLKKTEAETNFNLMAEFNKATNLDMLTDWLFNILDSYNDMIASQSNDTQHEFVTKIADYIAEHITENLSLSIVASAFGISTWYLSHIFKDVLNVNFSSYVNEKKFESAKDMLANNPELSVTDIAQKIGYYNMSYFIHQFKKKYGMTPLQYRKANIKQ